jgi:hypothetical protein
MATTTLKPMQGDALAALEAQQYLESRLQSPATVGAIPFSSIPVIDLSTSFSSSVAARQAVARQIHEACTTVGFFYSEYMFYESNALVEIA